MKIWWVPVLVLAVAIAGCSGGKKENKQTEQTGAQVQQHAEMPPPIQPPQPAETKPPQPKPAEPAAPKPAEPRPTPSPAARPAASGPVTKVVKLPPGYEFQVVLDEKISTETHRAGTPFQAKLVRAAVLKTDGEIIPAGSKIRGEVTLSKRAERVGGKADLTLEYRELVTPDGKSYPLFTEPLIIEGEGTAKGDVERTVGGAVGGAIIGGILGGKKGALQGGAAGGAAGAAWAVATRGNDVVIDPGQILQVTLTRALHVTATAPR
jgi:hypothetical protein